MGGVSLKGTLSLVRKFSTNPYLDLIFFVLVFFVLGLAIGGHILLFG